MESILLSGWEFAITNVSPATAVLTTVRDFITQRNFSAHQFFQNIGLGADKKDFNDIYYKALAKLEPITHPGVVKIFKDKAVMSHFEDSFGGGTTVEDLLEHIYAHIAAHPEYAQLQPTIQQDLEKLILFFLQTILESMDPETQYVINKLDAIKGDTEELRRLRSLDRAQDLEWQKSVDERLRLLVPHTPLVLSTGKGAVMTQEDFDDNVVPILNLLAKRRNAAAIDMLNDLKDRKWDRFSPEQRYKVNFTLGQAHLQLQQNAEAAELFISLADLLPLDADALGMTAMGYALKSNTEIAEHYIDKGLKISTIVPSAVVARLLNLPEGATIAQFDEVIASADMSNPMVAVNAAEWLSRQGPEHNIRALQLLEQTLIPEGTLAWAEKIERMAILHAKIALSNKIQDGNYTSKDTRDRLKLAEEWLSQAREFYKDSDMRNVRWAITANRGVVRFLLGDKEEAESDLVVALDDGKDFFIYHHLLMLGVERGKINIKLIHEARQHLDLSDEQEEELFFLEIDGLLEKKDTEAIFRLLDDRIQGKGEDETGKIIFFRSLAMMLDGDVKGAFKLASDTANKYPDNPQMAHRAAELAMQVGDEKKAHEYATRAAKSLGDNPASFIHRFVIELCYKLGHYQEVVDLLDKPIYKERWHNLLEFLLPSLQHVGRNDDAVEIVEKLYDPNNPIYFCTSFFLEALEKGCEYEEALTMAKNAMMYFPKDPFFHGKELAYYYRTDDHENIKEKLQEFKDQGWTVEDRMNALLIAIASAGRIHHMKGLELALEVWSENPHHPLYRKAYENFVIGLIEHGFKAGDQSVVDNFCTVELKDQKGGVIHVVIDDKGNLQNSISSSSERAQLLIGKQAGAVIELDGKRYMISKISSRYEAVFREIREVKKSNLN